MSICGVGINEVLEKLEAGWVLKGIPSMDKPFRLFDPYADLGWNLQIPAGDVRRMIDDNIIVEANGRFSSCVRSYTLNANEPRPSK